MLIDDKYAYTVTLNGIQMSLLEALVHRGLYGRNAADVIRRILDREFEKMVDLSKVYLKDLLDRR
jgi:hypothetical protein